MTKPYPFQKEGVAYIQSKKGVALLGDEMGLGKTFQSLLWAKKHLERGPIVVVCPSTIKENWSREARRHIDMRSTILEHRKTPAGGLNNHPGNLYIINYDILGEVNNPDSWVNVLKRINPQLVIGDEIHYVKDRSTIRSKAMKHLFRDAPHRIAISGTPMTNRPSELWPILNMLLPQVYNSHWSYCVRYCDPKKTFYGWDFRGASNLDELNAMLTRDCMIRRLKSEVMTQLPRKIRNVIPLDLENRKEYNEALHSFLKWLRKKSKSKALRAAHAERLVKVGYLKRLASAHKMKHALNWIRDFFLGNPGKLIVYAVHKSIVQMIHGKFKNISVVVDGSVTGAKRQKALDAFNKDPKTRLLIGNIQAAGVGWSCTSASDIAFVELPWVPGELTQAEDRIHGIARGTGSANYHFLVAKNTIEESLIRLLTQKQEVLDQALDGYAGASQLDILERLEMSLLQTKGIK